MGADKFFQLDEWVRQSYNYVKALKTILGVRMNTYLLKKLLLRHRVQSAKFGPVKEGHVLLKILSQPELKKRFESAIDFDKRGRTSEFYQQFIPLKTSE